MATIVVRGKFIRLQGKKVWVIQFEGKRVPSYVESDHILDTDVTKPGEQGTFEVPEWLASREELIPVGD